MASTKQGASSNGSIDGDSQEEEVTQQRRLASQVGPIEVDWPKAVGYYGGLAFALTVGLIEPPIGLFIAAVPLFKILNRPDASQPAWILGEVLQGAATPVGGSAAPVMRVSDRGRGNRRSRFNFALAPLQSIWADAQNVARGER